MTHRISGLDETLQKKLEDAFLRLSRGVADKRSAFHTPTLCTVAADGAPAARTVILREFDPRERVLTIHTDRRSAKADHLVRDARAQVHIYDGRRRLQVRLTCRAFAHTGDALAEAAWSRTRPESRTL